MRAVNETGTLITVAAAAAAAALVAPSPPVVAAAAVAAGGLVVGSLRREVHERRGHALEGYRARAVQRSTHRLRQVVRLGWVDRWVGR